MQPNAGKSIRLAQRLFPSPNECDHGTFSGAGGDSSFCLRREIVRLDGGVWGSKITNMLRGGAMKIVASSKTPVIYFARECLIQNFPFSNLFADIRVTLLRRSDYRASDLLRFAHELAIQATRCKADTSAYPMPGRSISRGSLTITTLDSIPSRYGLRRSYVPTERSNWVE